MVTAVRLAHTKFSLQYKSEFFVNVSDLIKFVFMPESYDSIGHTTEKRRACRFEIEIAKRKAEAETAT